MYFYFAFNIDSIPSPAYINHYDSEMYRTNLFPVFPFLTWTSVTLILAFIFFMLKMIIHFLLLKASSLLSLFPSLHTIPTAHTKILVMNTSYSEIEHLVCGLLNYRFYSQLFQELPLKLS